MSPLGVDYGPTQGSLPLCQHCNRQPKRIVRMYGSQLVWLCELHYQEYRGASLAADGYRSGG
jgi:hypothetical protein